MTTHPGMAVALLEAEGAGRRQQLWAAHLDGPRPSAARSWPLGGTDASAQAASEALAFAGDRLIASADLRAIEQALHGVPAGARGRLLARTADLRALALIAWPAAPDHAAEALLRHVDPESPVPSDAIARSAALVRLLRDRLASMDLFLLRDLAERLDTGSWPAATLLAEGAEARGGEPLTAASYADVAPRVPRRRRRPERQPGSLDAAGLAEALGPNGAVADALPGYEHRPGQVEMARSVAEAFNREEILLVEAGTGVGKSLAYLLPAAHWALATQQRVVIATHTKSLQDQLIGRDIPLLERALGRRVAAAAIKGRGNYLCARRLMARAREAEASLYETERLEAAYLLSWSAASEAGDLDDIGGAVRDALPGLDVLIARVRADSFTCLGRACPWRGGCAVERARRRAENADLVVANHALVLADTSAQVLPEYDRLIVDEAHNFEDVATNQFGLEFSRWGVQTLLRLLRGTGDRGGLLGAIGRAVEQARPERRASELLALAGEAGEAAQGVDGQIESVSAHLESFLAGGEPLRRGAPTTRRLTEQVLLSEAWQGPTRALQRVQGSIAAVGRVLAGLAAGLEDLGPTASADAEGLQRDVAGSAAAWQELAAGLGSMLAGPLDGTVAWVEGSRLARRFSWAMRMAPVDVGPSLKGAIYDSKRTVVLTSATLTVDREFDFLEQRLGLGAVPGRTLAVSVPSPFAYEQQLLLCVPQDIPSPRREGYADALCDGLLALARVTGGGMLVLFTSRTAMLEAYERLKGDFRRAGIQLLSQEVSGPRSDLLGRLRTGERTVLFGLKSFWEGVDVPGQALRCVVLAKLPFAVPSDPLIEARREHLDALGVDSQGEYYVPLAVMSFRQGVGRLIRTRRDRGAVFVMDTRLLTRPYGQRFVHSIERPTMLAATLERCLAAVAGWLGAEDEDGAVARSRDGW